MVVLATAATVIASQAVISGAFSLSRQAMQLGLLPPVTVRQTSEHEGGQIYLPGVNAVLFVGVLVVTLTFRSSARLATAYGVSVTGALVVDTLLLLLVGSGAVAVAAWKLAAGGGGVRRCRGHLPGGQPVQGGPRRVAAAARRAGRVHRHDHLATRTGDRVLEPA